MKKTYSRRKKPEPEPLEETLPSRERPPVDDEAERNHFQKVVNSFKCYRSHVSRKVNVNKQLIESLPENQQKLLKSYRTSLDKVQDCVNHNQELINLIIKDVEFMFENTSPGSINDMTDQQAPSTMDIERVQTTLKQFVRDWSAEGASEREACYDPIINEITKYFPPNDCTTEDVKVLVPGSGLGRLAFEIAYRGYSCQGNEFSLFMLIASNFVLNRCNGQGLYSVYPWIHQVDNNLSAEHQMQKVLFPDVNPGSLNPKPSQFTMAAGDFLEIYQQPNDWDCVATCFFIDCANNIVDFIEKIYEILRPGGIWVNLGPLLYHFSNMPGEFSLEPPYSAVKEIISGVGFVIEKEEVGVKTKYGQNPNSMLQYEYNSVFFVCRKYHMASLPST